jgi:Icc-related predicted phosphoesterase
MKLLVFSDIHGDIAALERLVATEADWYIAAGDLTSWGRGLDRCGAVLQRRAGRMWVLPGNHESDSQIAGFCERYGLFDFHCRTFQAGRWTVAGLGYSNPTPFNTPGEYSEQELAERLLRFADLNPLILICHAPPYGTELDQIRPGLHAGSTAVREFIERRRPRYFFCGHIHEAEGVAIDLDGVQARNLGKAGYVLDLGADLRLTADR